MPHTASPDTSVFPRKAGALQSDFSLFPLDWGILILLYEAQVITVRGRRFRVLERLSKAGRGRYLVRDTQEKRNYLAIQLAHTSALQQFEKSLRMLRYLDGIGNIPTLVVWGTFQQQRVWILSWQEGETLEERINRARRGLNEPCSIWEGVRRIRSLTHSLKILGRHCQIEHGDIRPENLIVPRAPGTLSLIDFGSSWQSAKPAARLEGDGCHDLYAAPEMIVAPTHVDFRCDQFSVSAVAFEVLTHELPYAGYGGKAGWPEYRSDLEPLYEPPSRKILDTSGVPKEILAKLDDVIGRGLSLDPKDRFETQQLFCDAWDEAHFALRDTQSDRMPEGGCMNLLLKFVAWMNKRVEALGKVR